jgi:hypothetical protein
VATTFKAQYGTNGQAITVTLASLASAASRASTAVDNTTNLFLDALVQIGIKTGTVAGTAYIAVYAYGTANNGTNYIEGVSGTDAGITLTSPTNLKLLGILNTPILNTTYNGMFNVAAAFGGQLPASWGIVIQNNTGGTLDATEANHLKVYQGLYAQGTP